MDPSPQSGGRVLGQGVYGCVFTPPLLCRGQTRIHPRSAGRLGKVAERDDVRPELIIGSLLKNSTSASKYVIVPDLSSLCVPEKMSRQSDPGIEDCKVFKRRDVTKMFQYEMPFGGKELKAFLKDFKIDTEVFPYFRFFGEMLAIGAFLALHGIVHNDIHFGNILIDSNFHPRLIDFGRAYTNMSVTRELIEKLEAGDFDPSYHQVPPEMSVKEGIDYKVPQSQIFAEIRAKKSGLTTGERLLGMNRDKQMNELRQFVTNSQSFKNQDWVVFFKTYWPQVDSWGIGAMLILLYSRMMLNRGFTRSAEFQQKRGIVETVLRRLLRASPAKRMDCVEALALYDPSNELIATPQGRAWLDSKRQQRGGGEDPNDSDDE